MIIIYFLVLLLVILCIVINIVVLSATKKSINEELTTIKLEHNKLESDTLSYVWLQHKAKVNEMVRQGIKETKSVVLVEGRKHHMLHMCLENLHERLPGWKLHVVHGLENESFVKELVSKLGFPVQLSKLNKHNLKVTEFSLLIGTRHFWRNICDTDRVLLSQTDAWICHDSKYRIEEFMVYDYVGAPWVRWQPSEPSKKETVVVGNCGLCLCKRQTMIETVEKYPYRDFVNETRGHEVDVYFGRYIENVPPAIIAKAFSVEEIWYDRPFGVHKPFGMNKTKLQQLEPHCEGIMNLLKY